MGQIRRRTVDLSDSIEATMLQQARGNELMIAYVRWLAITFKLVVDSLAMAFPGGSFSERPISPANAALTVAVWLACAGIAGALRRGHYQPWTRWALPAFDGLAIFSLFWVLHKTSPGISTTYADVVCTIFAMSGGLRFKRRSVMLTTGLAFATYVMVAALGGVGSVRVAFVMGAIVLAGFLGHWTHHMVHRAVESEVGRTMLARFLPMQVVNAAHSDPMALIATPKSTEATVVMTDMRGFTAFAERRPPTEVMAFLNELHGALAHAVESHGGTVDKFLGDGMLAVFGVTHPDEHHADHALLAASDILRAVDSLNVARERDKQEPFGIGVGVHSGVVVSGCVGSGPRLEFTVLGDTVNIASRLESATKELKVAALVSKNTVDRLKSVKVGDGFVLHPAQELALRGRTDAILVHRFEHR